MGVDLWPLLAGSGGAGFLGFIGGAIQQRYSSEARFNARVDERLQNLEKKVAECERERPLIDVLKMGMCMVVPELHRLDRSNPVLRNVANAFSALPQKPDSSLDQLMAKLREVPYP